jgi:hypothetical protein
MADQNINIKLLIDAAESAKTVQETKKALRDLKTAALQVEEGSQAFQSITTAAGQLQDKIGDLGATTKYLGDDLKNLKGFTSIASGIAGAFAAAQGAAALFGGQNKQLEASLLKVQSAMSILQGIQAVGEVLQKESAASLFIQNGLRKTTIALAGEEAIAKAGVAVANGTATITQRALNAAMTANPVMALVAVLVVATTALMAFSSSQKEVSESQKALNDSISKSRADLEVELRTFNSQIEALKQLKTGSEERAIAIKKINDQYGTTLKNLTDETAFLKQVNIAQADYVVGAKNRILSKINESKIEALLLLAQQQRESGGRIQRIRDEIADIKRKNYFNEEFRRADLSHWKQQLEDEAATNDAIAKGYEARADKILNINANLNTKETAQQKAAREKEAADALKAEQDKAKSIADSKTKTNNSKVKQEADYLKKLKELNEEYQRALDELVVETNDNIALQQELLLNSSGESEANAVALLRLDTESQITEEIRKQETELQKLVDIKVKETEASTGKAMTDVEKATLKTKIQSGAEYQAYLKSSNLVVQAITTQGEQSIYDIQKDWAERRRKLLEETTKRVLATDEYKRFIDFLNNARQMEMKLSEYQKTFGKDAVEILKSDKDIQDSNKSYREGLEETIKTEEALLASKQRNVDEQKRLNKELVEGGMITQQDVDRAIAEIEAENIKSKKKIADAKEFLKEDPQQTKIEAKGEGFFIQETIPQSAVEDLEKYYQKYKGNVEGLFDLSRKSNLDQLGANQKSIEILAALYGEKYNIIKKGEEDINKSLEGSGIKFGIDPKEGQVGLDALIDLTKKESKVLTEAQKERVLILLGDKDGLNKSLADNFAKVSEEEQKYFEKATFENYSNQQKRLADNKAAYATGEISKREFRKEEEKIDEDFNKEEANIKQNHEENLLAIGVVYGEKTQESIVEFGKGRKTEKQRQADEEIAIEQKKNDYLIAAAQSLYNTLRSFADATMAENISRIEDERDARLSDIDAELLDYDNRDKQITAAEQAKIDERKVLEEKKIALQVEYDKKVRDEKIKQFNIDKGMDIIQIGINTAVAVSRALIKEKFMIPYIITAGAAEAFFVAAQQPNFADGGLVVGPGGPKDDKIKANLSNGEVVINAKSSKKYAKILDTINQAGGGKPIPFRDGGMASVPVSTPSYDMEEFKSLVLDIINRPIETYVKESTITNAQKSQAEQNRRTSF